MLVCTWYMLSHWAPLTLEVCVCAYVHACIRVLVCGNCIVWMSPEVMAQTSEVLKEHGFDTESNDSFQFNRQTPSSSTCQCHVVHWSLVVMGSLWDHQRNTLPWDDCDRWVNMATLFHTPRGMFKEISRCNFTESIRTHRYTHSHTHLMEPAVLNIGIPPLGTMNRYWYLTFPCGGFCTIASHEVTSRKLRTSRRVTPCVRLTPHRDAVYKFPT